MWFIVDHLGSVITTTDHRGDTRQRYADDPWGQRRDAGGAADPGQQLAYDWSLATSSGTANGFTGHRHLDDVGLVHMNGRLYDPRLGVFMQADPFVQAMFDLQSYNRYGYCMASPMACSDPSGYSWLSKTWKKLWHSKVFRTVASIAVAYFLGPNGAYAIFDAGGAGVFGAGAGMANAAVAGFAAGAVGSGNLEGALQGAFTAGMFYGAGNLIGGGNFVTGEGASKAGAWGAASSTALHGVVGCVTSVAGGGKCGEGALSAAFSKSALVNGLVPDNFAGGLIVSAVVGGTASVLGGGKFENGATTAAYGYLFNELAHQTTNAQRGYADSSTARGASVLYGPVEGGGLYDRMVFVMDADGLVVATYRGSIDPDLARVNCANGCPTIAAGTHAITAADRQKYGGTILVVGNNGTVPTEGPNPNQGGQSFATGVYVHTGYRTTTGAEGCLTINPAQWRSFISHFPTGARGTVTVVR